MAFNLIKQAAIFLPEDVKSKLQIAYRDETSSTGKAQLKAILDNVALAEKLHSPVCQDTGTVTFYIKLSAKTKSLQEIQTALAEATHRATLEIPLRPNAVNPFTNKNSNDNVGRYVPLIHWEFIDKDESELSVMLKGGGSENASALAMLNPSEGLAELKRFVIESIVKAGAQPCPPTILGVAFGGGADAALFLAKKALLRPLGELNTEPAAAALENELLEAANSTGVGPMGLGGKTTVLGVHVDYADRHPASFSAAIAFSCWACRRATATISSSGAVEYLGQKAMGAK